MYLQESSDWDPQPVSELECTSAAATILGEYRKELALVEIEQYPKGFVRFHALPDSFPAKPQARRCAGCKFREVYHLFLNLEYTSHQTGLELQTSD